MVKDSLHILHSDRSHNVVVFGVPESRDLLGAEELVSSAFESVNCWKKGYNYGL